MDRATAPVVAVALLVAITVVAASAVGTAALAFDVSDDSTHVTASLSVDAATDRLSLTHRGGQSVNVSRLSLTISVAGRPLAEQPPVPFFAAAGFRSGPTGPFNSGADPRWSAGERTTLRVASTNNPEIEPGDTVTVTIRRGERTLVHARAVAA